jgi:hypothetical protein
MKRKSSFGDSLDMMAHPEHECVTCPQPAPGGPTGAQDGAPGAPTGASDTVQQGEMSGTPSVSQLSEFIEKVHIETEDKLEGFYSIFYLHYIINH